MALKDAMPSVLLENVVSLIHAKVLIHKPSKLNSSPPAFMPTCRKTISMRVMTVIYTVRFSVYGTP